MVDTDVYNAHYEYIIVAHVMGELEEAGEIATGFSDYEEYAVVINGIVEDWKNKKDIQSHEEEGYIAVYARRQLHETFFKSGDDNE